MHKQSNTPLYIVGACVVVIAIIVAVVRSNEAPEDKKKSGSPLAGLRLGALGASASASAAPAPADSSGMGSVQMLPITVLGRQGLLVRYQTEMLLEPVQQKAAETIVSKVKGEAEKAGVEVIVVMAVAPGSGGPGGPGAAAQTHTAAFERIADGTWVPLQEPIEPAGPASAIGSAPAMSGSASPASSHVPLYIPH
ncbi:MAG: hypothetical protein ACOC1F_02865 [Myxococcota bacterium]